MRSLDITSWPKDWYGSQRHFCQKSFSSLLNYSAIDMHRILYLEIDCCQACPYSEQEEGDVICFHPEAPQENFITRDYKDFDKNILPGWCPLPEKGKENAESRSLPTD